MDRDIFRAGNSSPSSSRTVLPPDHHYPAPHSYRGGQDPSGSSGSSAFYSGPPPIGHGHYPSHGLHHRSSNHAFHGPPIPPARSSSLTIPASPDSAHRVPTFQLIQPTPTKKKSRRKSAGGGSVSSGSPSLRGRTSTLFVETASLAEDDEEEDSDVVRSRKEEDRKARAREKGRERQRRKRERDKRAREDTRGHLPVPPRAHSHSSLTALTATHPLVPHSAPSSVSSTYSSLPFSASYYSLSPSQYGMSTGSTSVSGQSSPNVLFSPAISTPGIGYADAAWSTEGSMSQLDMTNTLRSRPKSRGGRNRTSSMSNSASRRPSREPTAVSPVVGKEEHRPEKRRKSQPEPPEFRTEVGLGMIIGGDAMNASWPALHAGEVDGRIQGRPRRSVSEANVLQQAEDWQTRSPTPPPVPSVPAEYRPVIPGPSSNAVEKASFFASSILLALGSDTNQGIASILKSELGLGKDELEGMRVDLAGVYEKWRLHREALENRMSQVSLDEDKDKLACLTSTSPTTSPPPGMQPFDSHSFVTPNPVRLRHRVASTSHIPSLAESPLTQAGMVRARALSASRPPLSIAQVPPPVQTRWDSPPVSKSNTESPTNTSLQTPSTAGQGSFPLNGAPGQAWQAQDVQTGYQSGGMDWQYQTASSSSGKPEQGGLESPLTMTKTAPSGPMGPPPLRDPSTSSGGATSVLHWTPSVPFTPSARTATRQNTVPFTPPTPMPVKGGEAPMWYQQTFLPGQSTPQGTMGRQAQMTPEQYTAAASNTPMTYPTTATADQHIATGQMAHQQQPDANAVFGYGYGQGYSQ